MFIVVPQVLDLPKADTFPLLRVADYPNSVNRMAALRLYYLLWDIEPFPFLDTRVVPHIMSTWRNGFVRFTNVHYYYAIRQLMVFVGTPNRPAQFSVCADCARSAACKNICLVALDSLRYERYPNSIATWINRFTADDFPAAQRKQDLETSYIPHGLISLLWSHITRRAAKSKAAGRVGSVPADQEEWWTE